MRIITIASPDKISINMFTKFVRNGLKSFPIGEMHSLMSTEAVNSYVDNFIEKNGNAIFTYYAKRKINMDPISIIPLKLQETSDVVVWLNLYSTDPIFVKDRPGFSGAFLPNWKVHVENLGGSR